MEWDGGYGVVHQCQKRGEMSWKVMYVRMGLEWLRYVHCRMLADEVVETEE